ncbi:MAG TPA: 4-alpha-glucanotransferase [Candidatus Sumerlaeota bacterium]|nr:4-alpha-glucanotransferase [Candidatus Sumerlaeota bacterium]HOR28039.1 4-alpha-glucanotransferase [Candidatus Sumerlaeota bacterium]HPK02853.1 4-alpha-glucanotransferase [Candidatus Sumerlaeota bacterium]
MRSEVPPPLRRLARYCGIKTWYFDNYGRRCHAPAETLLGILRSLGVAIDDAEQAEAALADERRKRWDTPLEPVAVAWEGEPARIALRLPEDRAGDLVHWTLRTEQGGEVGGTLAAEALPTRLRAELAGRRYLLKHLPLPDALPAGYHQLSIRLEPREPAASGRRSKRSRPAPAADALIIRAPGRAYDAPDVNPGNAWGVFLPLYALKSARNYGAGHFGELSRLADWVNSLGGSIVATLPLLAAFLDEPHEPSPYAPASRLFWNEFYLDMESIPELERCPEARRLLEAPEFAAAAERFRQERIVDYREQMRLRREPLAALARAFFREPLPTRRLAFEQFLERNPAASDYAAFRAAVEKSGSWHGWTGSRRDGLLTSADYDAEARQYHLYVQFVAEEQVNALAERMRRGGPGLYLDLPLGVHPDSYDVWRHREQFAHGVSGGAPPDEFFSRGQNWGFAPLHPRRIRQTQYRYVIQTLRQLMRQAGMLRIDHVMWLHRLYWIPQGAAATAGTYVHYPAEELFAILCLESHRHRTRLVGEDLGTVPEIVRRAMTRRGLARMYVMQFAVHGAAGRPAIDPVPAGAVASLNTHDTPTFAAFWEALDVEDRLAMDLVDAAGAEELRRQRDAIRHALRGQLALSPGEDERARACAAAMKHLAAGPASVVLVNLEDLWGEREPQNTPGTHLERVNWRRKGAVALEELLARDDWRALLSEIDALRRARRSG